MSNINDLPHPEEARSAVSKDASALVRAHLSFLPATASSGRASERIRLSNPLAGLDPAIHVFFLRHSLSNKDVDPRDKPGGGEFFDARM
jgi:hypothetical protein